MSEEMHEQAKRGLNAEVADAEQRLRRASEAAAQAEERATAEILALEADLEQARQQAAEELEQVRRRHAEELAEERSARDRAIAAAQGRLSEIEAQAGAAEKRVEEAERKAAAAEGSNADLEARAREAAATWLRGQVEAIRREAAGR